MTNKVIAIYARAYGSNADTSLVIQTDACRRLAERQSCADPEYFLERDSSGCGIGDALDRLLTECEKGRFHAVVAASRDRINRDPVKLDGILKLMARHGVTAHFVSEDHNIAADPI